MPARGRMEIRRCASAPAGDGEADAVAEAPTRVSIAPGLVASSCQQAACSCHAAPPESGGGSRSPYSGVAQNQRLPRLRAAAPCTCASRDWRAGTITDNGSVHTGSATRPSCTAFDNASRCQQIVVQHLELLRERQLRRRESPARAPPRTAACQRGGDAGLRQAVADGDAQMALKPCRRPALLTACSTVAITRRHSPRNTWPAQVSRVRRVLRSNNCTPSWLSRSRIARDTGDARCPDARLHGPDAVLRNCDE